MNSFNDILGHESIKAHMMQAIVHKQLSHAYILSGPKGSGKSMLADCFAAGLLCSRGEGDPCGMCISCIQAESHNHPDIVYVTHEKANILVNDIRDQLINDISIKPYSGDYKVYIIPDAEKMNEAAQNALLKTLEEPPSYAVILLLATGTGAFLQTILSRCVVMNLKPVKNEVITEYLMREKHLPDYFARLCAAFSEGSVGQAVKFAEDEEFTKTKDEVISLVKGIRKMSQGEIMNFVNAFDSKEKKAAFSDYLDLMVLWFHDLLVYKTTGDASRLLFANEKQAITAISRDYSLEKLNRIFLAIDDTRAKLNANVSFDVTLELLLLSMK